jgi:Protein of unknown function (DUF3102)
MQKKLSIETNNIINLDFGQQKPLPELAKEIRGREEVIQALFVRTVANAHELICEVNLCGKVLLETKERLGHGKWMQWLEDNCPEVSYWTANRYMRIASKWERVRELEEVSSLRGALALCRTDDEKATAKKGSARWPQDVEGLGKLWRFCEFERRHPIEDWPEQSVEQLRTKLEPLAKRVWPAAFARVAITRAA